MKETKAKEVLIEGLLLEDLLKILDYICKKTKIEFSCISVTTSRSFAPSEVKKLGCEK